MRVLKNNALQFHFIFLFFDQQSTTIDLIQADDDSAFESLGLFSRLWPTRSIFMVSFKLFHLNSFIDSFRVCC